jgi:hypothetical protein
MKASLKKLPQAPQASVFPKTLHRLRASPNETSPSPKSKKRDNIFSKSRDTREDRGERQIKTSHNAQTFTHSGR